MEKKKISNKRKKKKMTLDDEVEEFKWQKLGLKNSEIALYHRPKKELILKLKEKY